MSPKFKTGDVVTCDPIPTGIVERRILPKYYVVVDALNSNHIAYVPEDKLKLKEVFNAKEVTDPETPKGR